MELTQCPICESTAITKKKGKRILQIKERTVTTPVITFWECESCGEVFYPPESGKRLDQDVTAGPTKAVGPAVAKRLRAA